MNAFELTGHDLGELVLRPLSAEAAEELGPALAAIPPWSVIGWPAERMTLGLKRQLPSVKRFEVLASGAYAGIIVILDPFLHGPYLQLLAVLPEFQGRNLGLRLLQWMESEARGAEAQGFGRRRHAAGQGGGRAADPSAHHGADPVGPDRRRPPNGLDAACRAAPRNG